MRRYWTNVQGCWSCDQTLLSPSQWNCNVEDGECLRAHVLHKQVGDDCRSDSRVARLSDANHRSQEQECVEVLVTEAGERVRSGEKYNKLECKPKTLGR